MKRLVTILERRSTTAAIVAAGMAARLLYLCAIANHPLASDAASYTEMARQLGGGQHFIPYWPPGLPLFLAAMRSVFGASELAARLVMLSFYLLLSYALYRTTVYLTSEAACGNLALMPLAFTPGMICASVETNTEMPAAALLMVVACALIRIKQGKAGSAPLVLGVSIGCLSLLRPASLVLLLLAPLYVLWRTRSRLGFLSVGLIPAVMVFAWIWYVGGATGHWVFINTANARNFYLGNNPQTPLYRTWWMGSHHEPGAQPATSESPEKMASYSTLARTYIRNHPGLFLLRTVNRICAFFALDTYFGAYIVENYGWDKSLGLSVVALDSIIYIILAMGFILYLASLDGLDQPISTWSDRSIHGLLLASLCLLYAGPYFLAFSHPRFHFPIEPLLMAATAAFMWPFIQGAPRIVLDPIRAKGFAVTTALAVFVFIQIEFVVIIVRAGLV